MIVCVTFTVSGADVCCFLSPLCVTVRQNSAPPGSEQREPRGRPPSLPGRSEHRRCHQRKAPLCFTARAGAAAPRHHRDETDKPSAALWSVGRVHT